MDTQAEGILYEHQAGVLLEEKGYKLIDRNVNYPKVGELDIVAMDGKTLVIVEVKYTATKEFGYPIEQITPSKIRKIIKATERYLAECPYRYDAVRFDAVCFLDGIPEHIENAFYGRWH